MKGFRVWFVALIFCALVRPALGATSYYIRFEDPEITGSSTTPGHSGEIEVIAWSHGFERSASSTRGTVEAATHSNLEVTKDFDIATETLLKNCWSGKSFRKVTLTCYRSDHAGDGTPVRYLEVVMRDVVISGMSFDGDGSTAVEKIALSYGTVTYNYIGKR